jgi:hypothetical protein
MTNESQNKLKLEYISFQVSQSLIFTSRTCSCPALVKVTVTAKIEQVALNSTPSPWLPAVRLKAQTFFRKNAIRLPSPENKFKILALNLTFS